MRAEFSVGGWGPLGGRWPEALPHRLQSARPGARGFGGVCGLDSKQGQLALPDPAGCGLPGLPWGGMRGPPLPPNPTISHHGSKSDSRARCTAWRSPRAFSGASPPKAGATTVATAALCARGTPTPPRGWAPLACNHAQGHCLPPRPSAPPPGSHWPPSEQASLEPLPSTNTEAEARGRRGPRAREAGRAGSRAAPNPGRPLVRPGLLSQRRRRGLGSQGRFRKRGRTAPRARGRAPSQGRPGPGRLHGCLGNRPARPWSAVARRGPGPAPRGGLALQRLGPAWAAPWRSLVLGTRLGCCLFLRTSMSGQPLVDRQRRNGPFRYLEASSDAGLGATGDRTGVRQMAAGTPQSLVFHCLLHFFLWGMRT